MPREVRAGVLGFFWTLFPSFVVEPEICPIMEPIDPKIGLLCLHKVDVASAPSVTHPPALGHLGVLGEAHPLEVTDAVLAVEEFAVREHLGLFAGEQ